MTLFTAVATMVGHTRLCLRGIGGNPSGYVGFSYVEWLATQEYSYEEYIKKHNANGNGFQYSWIMDVSELYARRAPGNTCLSALRAVRDKKEVFNNSKGCGGIMRVAPVALYFPCVDSECNHLSTHVDISVLAKEGAECAAITHKHPLGYLPAALMVHIINRIVYKKSGREMSLVEIIEEAKNNLQTIYENAPELKADISYLNTLIDKAVLLSDNNKSDRDNIRELGEGWVAEETLAIAIFCTLRYQDNFDQGIIASVNHSGDSDSTGAVTGNILGAWLGMNKISDKWTKNLELLDVIKEISIDLCRGCKMSEYGEYHDDAWVRKYIEMKRA